MSATPGTITAGELRREHLAERELLTTGGRTGKRIHVAFDCRLGSRVMAPTRNYSYCGVKGPLDALECPDSREIDYSRLCRHCFRELLKDTRA